MCKTLLESTSPDILVILKGRNEMLFGDKQDEHRAWTPEEIQALSLMKTNGVLVVFHNNEVS
jgi:hypothetical protein